MYLQEYTYHPLHDQGLLNVYLKIPGHSAPCYTITGSPQHSNDSRNMKTVMKPHNEELSVKLSGKYTEYLYLKRKKEKKKHILSTRAKKLRVHEVYDTFPFGIIHNSKRS